MGYGGYSYEAHQAITTARAALPAQKVFTQKGVHPSMNPLGVKLRECRDSPDHPNSVPICFALDVSGSMGDIPRELAQRELPTFMKTLLDTGVDDPQVLFTAFCDARYDDTPLQVGQFESTAELMDTWLTRTCLEAVVRGTSYTGKLQGGESYELTLYWIAKHTVHDAWEKRQKKGYLIMTGDEEAYPAVPRETVLKTLGYDIPSDIPIADVMRDVRRAWNPFFLIPDHKRRTVESYWRGVFGDDVVCMESSHDTCAVSASLIALSEGVLRDLDAVAQALSTRGTEAARVKAVVQAIRPWWEKRTAAR